MVTRFARVGVIVLVIGASIAGYRWWTSPERRIRRVLDGVAEGFSHDAPATALGAVAAVAALQPYLAPEVTVEPGRPLGVVTGRDAVLATAARLRSSTPSMRIEFVDVQINVGADNQSAEVDCTAMATLQDRAGQESVDAREVIITMNTLDGRWVITRARAIEVLEPLIP